MLVVGPSPHSSVYLPPLPTLPAQKILFLVSECFTEKRRKHLARLIQEADAPLRFQEGVLSVVAVDTEGQGDLGPSVGNSGASNTINGSDKSSFAGDGNKDSMRPRYTLQKLSVRLKVRL